MKKALSLLLICVLLLSGCSNKQDTAVVTPEPVVISQSVDSYFIDGTLENNSFTAIQKVNYVNKEQQPLSELYFHLYANIYKDKEGFETESLSSTFPNGFNPGGIEVSEVSLLGVPLDTEITDKHIKINLATPLPPMESLIITFKYKTSLPNATSRMGYYNDCYNLTGFYPVAAVFEDGKWQIDKYGVVGDPFFTDMSDYYVTLNLPENFTVASSGNYTKTSQGNMQELNIIAPNVREIAVVASPNMKVAEDVVDGITVRSYYVPSIDDAYGQLALEYAKSSVAYFNATFGKYPYNQLSVVGSEFVGGGMEYPNLTIITRDVYKEERKSYLEWVVAHEIAHQWWYGLVGSDPVNNSFVDESLTEYSTWSYIKSRYDSATADAFKNKFILTPFERYRSMVDGKSMHKSTAKFENSLELSLLVYNKGCMMYMDMENFMGQDKLKEILRSYYEKNAYSIVTPEKWKQHFKDSYTYDWDAFFKKWIG